MLNYLGEIQSNHNYENGMLFAVKATKVQNGKYCNIKNATKVVVMIFCQCIRNLSSVKIAQNKKE
jgi:hypothetical protein